MTGAVSAKTSFPTKCPPAAPVGKALGLHVTGPTVVAHMAGMALECQYKSAKLKTTLVGEADFGRVSLLGKDRGCQADIWFG